MLNTGDIYPDFQYHSYDGSDRSLYSKAGNCPAVILFLRYMGCTKCQYDILDLLAHSKEISERDLRIFIVFQSDAAIVRESIVPNFPFEIICDPERLLYKEFDVCPAGTKEELLKLEEYAEAHSRFREERERLGLWHGKYEGEELQKPAIFILDPKKRLIFCHYADSLMDMPSTEEWLKRYDEYNVKHCLSSC